MIKCLLCGKDYRALAGHLQRAHGISTYNYREQFPGASTQSEETWKGRSAWSSAMWDIRTPEERSWIGRNRRSGWTDKSYENMMDSRAEMFRSLSDDKREKLTQRMHSISDRFHNHPDFERAREARSLAIAKSWREHLESDPQFYEEARQRMLVANRYMHKWLRTCSKEELAEFLDRSFLGSYKKRFFEYKGKRYGVRSSYERKVLETLVNLGLEFKYEAFLKRSDGRWYRADFIVEEKVVIEPKSSYWYEVQGGDFGDKKREEACELAGYSYLLLMEDQIWSDNLSKIIGDKVSSTSAGQSKVRPLVDDIV